MLRSFIKGMLAVPFAVVLLLGGTAYSQTTSFTYQGKLTDNTLPANGTYQMQFGLYDASSVQIGLTISKPAVVVANGIFTVQLDFGSGSFPGGQRFLQIGVFSAAGNAFVTLSPRQPITSAPYAVRALDSSTADISTDSIQLGGVPASQYVVTTDPRMTDDRDPLPGSNNYIRNSGVLQSTANFNVSGTGAAASFNASTQYNINGNRVLSISGVNNLFMGQNAGTGAQNTGAGNVFSGFNAGTVNTTGSFNSFVGSNAGAANTTAINNAFFGQGAGFKNTTGSDNTFVGNGAGLANTASASNTFIGSLAGQANTGGSFNTFLGVKAGTSNIGSSNNTFVGANAANSNLTGSGNTYIGADADGSVVVSNATAIGQKAFAGQSNSVILGSINGVNGSVADTSVGVGTSAPDARLHILNNSTASLLVESNTLKGAGIELKSTRAVPSDWLVYASDQNAISGGLNFHDNLSNTTPVTINGSNGGSVVVNGTMDVSQALTGDFLYTTHLNTGGDTAVCWESTFKSIARCSSSLRYKKDVAPFAGGLALVRQLRPITFKWKSTNAADLGFGAEDVAKIEPLLVSNNEKGEIEGVKYDRISAALVNAVKEQQAQIELQQKQINALTIRLARVERLHHRRVLPRR